MEYTTDVFSYIQAEEKNYQSIPITPVDGWDWNMYEHVKLSILYKNSQFETGNTKSQRDEKPFKNVTRPLLSLQYRAEGFDVKDVTLYVDDVEQYYKSFLVKKFHDKWARENQIDTFIDQVVESYVDFGGVLVKDVNNKRPEWVPFQRIAFCDQTDILSGPICEKHYFAPDQLMEMASKGWENLDQVIQEAENATKTVTLANGKQVKTPGKYIEVYELHGALPSWWLTDDAANPDENERYTKQIQIVTFYTAQNGNKYGITLFKGKESESPYKFLSRDAIYGRALGLGGAEELFDPQVWTNYDIIRMKGLLDATSKVLLYSTDPTLRSKHPSGLKNLENLEVLDLAPNAVINQVNTAPVSISLFERAVSEWEIQAQKMAAATDAMLGESPSSGTPFALQNLIVQQGQQLHTYRQGKIAVFVEEIYREWIMPYFAREIARGTTFLSELDLEELQHVADSLVACEANKLIKEKIFNGETIDPAEIEKYKQQVRDQFMKGGNQHFIKILQGELKSVPLEVKVSIKNKQKDIAGLVDKMSKVIQFAFSTYNPQTGQFGVFQDPRMAQLFNEILEYSGLNQIDYGAQPKQPMMQMQPQPQQPQPQQPALVGAAPQQNNYG